MGHLSHGREGAAVPDDRSKIVDGATVALKARRVNKAESPHSLRGVPYEGFGFRDTGHSPGVADRVRLVYSGSRKKGSQVGHLSRGPQDSGLAVCSDDQVPIIDAVDRPKT